MSKPYSKKYLSIKTIDHLCNRLGFPRELIEEIASNAESLYHFEKKEKKNGDFRIIAKPAHKLKIIQKSIHRLLMEIKIADCAHGGVKNKSNFTNAKKHCNQECLLNYDFKNFFPNISNHKVYDMFFTDLKCSPEVASLLTKLCTVRYQVPQGVSTSTDIANLVCRRIDIRLEGLAKRYKINYTRFVDDISFSGNNIPLSFKRMVEEIIKKNGFTLNPAKEIFHGRYQLQLVTGLSVNRKNPKVLRKTKREWRKDKFLFEKMVLTQPTSKVSILKKEQQIHGRENYQLFIG